MSHPRRVRRIALLTLFAFGCATIRVPAQVPPPPAPHPPGPGLAEPELLILFEGPREPDAAEQTRSVETAREALSRAMEGRGAVAASQGAVLKVRERAVVRTSARKTDQTLAIVGIAVTVVLVIVAIVVSMSSGKGSSSGAKTAAARPASAARAMPAPPARFTSPGRIAPAPPPGTARVNPPLPPRPRVPLAPIYPAFAPDIGFHVGFLFVFPPPEPYLEPPYAGPPDAEPPAFQAPYAAPPGAPAQGPAVASGAEPPAEPPPPPIPPPPPFNLANRGFFDGEEAQLEIVLEDARTGQPLWASYVREKIDPRDPEELAGLVEKALLGQAWAAKQPAAAREPAPR
jgi:hypothetical protein